jgi:glycosyltransferase involved in cell wall biosynthesis
MITIGYSGTLNYYNPNLKKNKWHNPFSIYRHNFELSKTRSPYYLFKAIKQLKDDDHKLANKLKVCLWGLIDSQNSELVKKLGIQDIVCISGNLPKNESLEKLKSCDVLFLPIEKASEDHKTLFIPGKVFEYLALKIPVLILDKDSDCSKIVKNSGLGIIADCENIDNITYVLNQIINDSLLSSIKENINHEYIESLSFKYRANDMARLFNELLEK